MQRGDESLTPNRIFSPNFSHSHVSHSVVALVNKFVCNNDVRITYIEKKNISEDNWEISFYIDNNMSLNLNSFVWTK